MTSRRSARGALALCVLVLAACNAPEAAKGPGFRDPAALIGATSRYDAARFAGVWQVRATFPGEATLRRITVNDPGVEVGFELVNAHCDPSGICADKIDVWRGRVQGPGRYALDDPNGGPGRQLWVLWVDEGFRTAVVGTPTGRYGWILDRNAIGGADRIKAAKEILDFNGYDVSQLQVRQ